MDACTATRSEAAENLDRALADRGTSAPSARARLLIAGAGDPPSVPAILTEHFDTHALPAGQDVGDAIERWHPDVVVVVGSTGAAPWRDPAGLLRELHADPRTSDVPVLVLAATDDPAHRLAALEAGADDWLFLRDDGRELLARACNHARRSRARRAHAARYEGVFGAMQEGLVLSELVTDAPDGRLDFRYLEINPAAERILGMSRDRVVGRTAREILPAPQEDMFELSATVIRTGVPQRREIYEPLVQQHHESIFFRPAEGQVAVLFSDVTGRKLAEHRIAVLVSDIDDHLVAYDRQWRYTFVNAAAARTLGRSEEELLGRSIWELFPDAVGNPYYQVLHQALEEQRVLHQEHYYAPFGRWFENHIYPSADGVTVFSTDITARKLVEAELREHQEALREVDRRKDEFLAVLAHELRNPLAAIRNAVELLRRTGSSNPAEGALLAFGILERQVRHMVRQVDDLLDVSRISQGRLELRPASIDLVGVVRDALESSGLAGESTDRVLETSFPAAPVPVHGDAVRLGQAIGNLLHNARKFSDPGSRIALRMELESDGGQVALRVRDHGIGIAPDQLDRIFDMFVQVDTSRERTRSGLGLGLSLVKTIVELHGGTVTVCSDGAGSGSEFTLRLPVEGALEALPHTGPRPGSC